MNWHQLSLLHDDAFRSGLRLGYSQQMMDGGRGQSLADGLGLFQGSFQILA